MWAYLALSLGFSSCIAVVSTYVTVSTNLQGWRATFSNSDLLKVTMFYVQMATLVFSTDGSVPRALLDLVHVFQSSYSVSTHPIACAYSAHSRMLPGLQTALLTLLGVPAATLLVA